MNISHELIWLVIGIVFIFSELFIPSFVIAFFGGGALITALLRLIIGNPFTLALQLIVFIISSILLLVLLRKYLQKIFMGKLQDERDDQDFNVEIGKIVIVIQDIQPGGTKGKVKYQGTNWAAKASEKIVVGESVKIIGCENITLIVEKLKEEN